MLNISPVLYGILVWVFVPCAVFAQQSTGYNENYQYPSNAGVIDVTQPPFNAKGDGIADDTEAIQRAFDSAHEDLRTIYLPNGTYLVSKEIFWTRRKLLQGQSRKNTILKLKDRAQGFESGKQKPVLHCYFSNNETIANWIENLTVDIGKGNNGAIGIRFNSHNQGTVRGVNIIAPNGEGAIGLDMTENEVGPCC